MTIRHAVARRLLLLAAVLILIGATASLWPDSSLIGTFGRMFDSLAPHLLAGMALTGVAAAI